MRLCERLDAYEIRFRTSIDRARGYDAQQPALHMFVEADSHRREIADHFGAIRIIAHEHGALAPTACRLRKGTAQCCLRSARKSGDQHHRAAIVPAAEHGIETRDATRDTFVRDLGVD